MWSPGTLMQDMGLSARANTYPMCLLKSIPYTFNRYFFVATIYIHGTEGASESSWKMHVFKKLCINFKFVLHQNKHLLILFFSDFLKYSHIYCGE